MEKILWPFGEADVLSPAYAASVAIEIDNNMTIIVAPALTGAIEFDLSAHAELRPGAIVVINVDQGATGRDVTFGSEVVGAGITGVANDKDTVTLQWTGSKFRVISNIKIVDAA